ncbi:MAG: metallophosphoesterase [Verrucomicrobiales bacterium]|nr:metallophosphoesterase [Verrucomicrobiales bacterium]
MEIEQRQIFITSDWHLGGTMDSDRNHKGIEKMGSSIFRDTENLTKFLDWIREQASVFDGKTEVVLNGDIVDFLAPNNENEYTPEAWQNNAEKINNELTSIAERFVNSEGRGPFQALRDLVSEGCEVTVLLGNHDVELCLPGVRNRFQELIGGQSKNVQFIYDGEAYVYGRLLVEHGNRYDPFNAVDFSLLRQERSMLSRGFSIDENSRGNLFFEPPVGSSIVVNEINPLLHEVPFLNLLKPEFGAAIPLMLAFYPETRGFFEMAFVLLKIGKRVKDNSLTNRPGLLSGSPLDTYTSLNDFLKEELGDDAKSFLSPPKRGGTLSRSEPRTGAKFKKLAAKAAESLNLELPWDVYRICKEKSDTDRMAQVRIALRKVRDSTAFDHQTEKVQYMAPAYEIVETGLVDTVVFGHTHFPKEVILDDGAKYLNAGTWADVLRLPEAISSEIDEEAYSAIDTFLEDIKNQNYEPYTLRPRTYVRAVVDSSGSVEAALKSFEPNG